MADRSPPSAPRPLEAGQLLRLARKDRAAANRAVASLSLEQQLALVCDAPAARRAALIELAPAPEQLIPLLPEAEFCFTAKAVGLESSAWLLEYATPEQVVACLDLDAWEGHSPVPAKLDAWIDAIAAAGDGAALRGIQALDPELIVLYLMQRVSVELKPNDDEDWQPPEGGQTLDGQFYFVALHDGDDVAAIVRILRLLFQADYWFYFRMLQGVIWEISTENVEWAHRWRVGRLQDLGFPTWEEAMELYGYLSPKQRLQIDPDHRPLSVEEWHLPVWIPGLPEGRDSKHSLFRTLAGLEPEERRSAFYAFVSTANKVAVADYMEISDVETTPKAIDKAARWISRGLEHVARERGLTQADVVQRVPLDQLFRIGANLDPDAARPPRPIDPSDDVDASGDVVA